MCQAFCCDGLDTPQAYIWNEKNSQKNWAVEIWDWAQIALLGPPEAQKGSNTRSKCVFTMNLTQAGQWGAVGTKYGPPGPSKDLGGPQKGLLGPKRALLGPPGAQRGPDTRSKCVLTMNLTQSGQWGAVGTKSGSSGALRSFSSS